MLAFEAVGASKAIGIEKDGTIALKTREKGFDVYNRNAECEEIPKADVYYIWIKKSTNIRLAEKILKTIDNCTVIIGGDSSVGEVYDMLIGPVREIKYMEGIGLRQFGVFRLKILTK